MAKKGFTLPEMTIYLGILAITSLPLLWFFGSMIFGDLKTTTFQEIQENGSFALMKIISEIKKAKGIISPSTGTSGSTLSLFMEEESQNPTIFDVFEGKLRISRGENPPQELTSELLVVKNIKFTNLSYAKTPGIILVEIEIEPKGGAIFQVPSGVFKTSVSLRPSS